MSADSRVPVAIRVGEVHHFAPWGRTTTFKLIKSGVLPAKKLAGCNSYVMREDLEALLRGGDCVVGAG